MKFVFKLILFTLACLISSQVFAQQSPPPISGPTPLPSVDTPPVVPTPAPRPAPMNPNDPVPSLADSLRPTSAGKYEEYQSICREREYDRVAYVSPEIKTKRIQHLQDKISSTLTNTKLKLRLLKEYIDQGLNVEAEKFYTALKNESLKDEDSDVATALISILRNEKNRAQTLLSGVVVKNPKNKEALSYLAELYLQQKNYFESAEAYIDLQRMTKISYDLELCEVYSLHSQHKEAESYCRKAIRANPGSPIPYLFLGVSHRERLMYKESIEYFKQSLKLKPTEMGYTCLAEVYYITEKLNDSVEYFKKAQEHNSSSYRAIIGLAWAEFKAKKFDDALITFSNLCRKDKRFKVEIRKAYKSLTEMNSPFVKKYADASLACPD